MNVSTALVAATFRLRHFRSGNDRSGYHLRSVMVFWNRPTNTNAFIPLTCHCEPGARGNLSSQGIAEPVPSEARNLLVCFGLASQ